LKILGSVGEPINPEAWLWYHNVVGDGRCAIVDTFWQTETVFAFAYCLPQMRFFAYYYHNSTTTISMYYRKTAACGKNTQ